MMLYKSQHLQRIIREITYSESTGILVVLFISRRIAFAVLYVKVTLDYANCGAGLVHYKNIKQTIDLVSELKLGQRVRNSPDLVGT